jgi:hypothetical protein
MLYSQSKTYGRAGRNTNNNPVMEDEVAAVKK